jgi:uncharacterized protein YodC (DUF2158 family)
MEQKFKIGDTVILKSGGPEMTVDELHHYTSFQGSGGGYSGKVRCRWFIETQDKFAYFHQDTLEKS